ncbi:DUF6898 family protein [Insolitispirillum peregrinum]|uniref:DUF6898 family protein n=1 Tax=Insolitispirillum peregrinum TaxID=80876 RepID=UPI00360DB547
MPANVPTGGSGLGEVLFEIKVFGASARVSALHVSSNTEVTVICPANLHKTSMQQAALRKLRFMLEKKP